MCKNKPKFSPWISPAIHNSIRHKSRQYNAFNKNPTAENELHFRSAETIQPVPLGWKIYNIKFKYLKEIKLILKNGKKSIYCRIEVPTSQKFQN